MNPYLRLILNISRSILLPWTMTFSLCKLLYPSPAFWSHICVSLLCVPVFLLCKNRYASYSLSRQASRLQAHEIPKVDGKWPGNLDVLLWMLSESRTGSTVEFFKQLMYEYNCNTINLYFLWTNLIVTVDESFIKCMLTGEGVDHFTKGYLFRECMESLLGNGIFNSDGDLWAAHRSAAKPFIATNRFYDPTILSPRYTILSDVIQSMRSSTCSLSQAFDIQDMLRRFTLDVACTVLFGEGIHSLSSDLFTAGNMETASRESFNSSILTSEAPTFDDFTRAFERIKSNVTIRAQRGKFWPLLELLHDKTKEDRKTIKEFLQPIVRRAMQEKETIKGPVEGSYLNHLVRSTDDEDLVRDELLNMLFAARDGTATLMTFAVYFFCLHPKETSRLREEILQQYGVDSDPSLESLSRLQYLRAWINECLRLFPPIPMNTRLSGFNRVFQFTSSGTERSAHRFIVPPESQIVISTLLLHRRKDLWGTNADIFYPDRWLNNVYLEGHMKKSFAFAPFSAGSRICLGQNVAYAQASFIIIKLLQQFDHFELAPDAQPAESLPIPEWKNGDGRQAFEKIWPSAEVTLSIKGGLWVRCRSAS